MDFRCNECELQNQLTEFDRRVRLPDGRWLGYAEYGDQRGRPLLSFHGGLSCRLDVAFASSVCRELGIRLLAVDRPGTGLSEDKAERTILDWPLDVANLARGLGIERFAVLGWSAGGPFALACAYGIPDMVTRAGTIGGMAPVKGRRGAIRELGLRLDRILLPLASWSPGSAAFLLRLARRLPMRLLKRSLMFDLGSPADRALVRSFRNSEFEFFYESLRPGPWGAVQEFRILAGPWGSWLSDVKTEVHLWQGAEDQIVPMSHARWLAEHIPGSQLRVVQGQGHFLLRACLREVLSTLVG